MANTSEVVVRNSGGIGFCGMLALVFITLKLCNVIAWSWLWVLAPLWIPFVIVFGILLIVLIIALICAAIVGLAKLIRG